MKKVRLILLLASASAVTIFVVVANVAGVHRAESLERIVAPQELLFHLRLSESKLSAATSEVSHPELATSMDSIAAWSASLDLLAMKGDRQELQFARRVGVDSGGWTDVSPADIDRMMVVLDSYQPVIDSLRAAALLDGPTRSVVLSPTREDVQEWAQSILDSAVILSLDAIARSRRGDMDGAIENCGAGMRLVTALTSEPAQDSQFLAYEVFRRLYDVIREGFPLDSLDSESALKLFGQINRLPGRETLIVAVRAHNFERKRTIERILHGGWLERWESLEDYFGGSTNETYLERAFNLGYVSPLGRPWLNRHVTFFSEYLEFRLEMAKQPFFQTSSLASTQNDIQQDDHFTPFAPRQYPEDIFVYYALHEARIRLLRIGILLEQARLTKARYPQSLTTLSFALTEETLTDPFSGEPFRYTAQDETFTLYSVGRNMEDDRDYWMEEERGGYTALGDDIIWRK